MAKRAAKTGGGVLIELTTYGGFFIRDAAFRIWDGESWRGFGAAQIYPDYAAAFRARRAAISAA